MKGHLIIPVEYKGKQLEFRGKLLKGKGRYGYKIKLKVDSGEVVFEEEVDGMYKVRVSPDDMEGGVDWELVEVIKGVVQGAGK